MPQQKTITPMGLRRTFHSEASAGTRAYSTLARSQLNGSGQQWLFGQKRG